MNTVTNFIPNETITCDDQDPPWMNSFMKNLIHAKDNFYKKFFHKNNNMYHLCAFTCTISVLLKTFSIPFLLTNVLQAEASYLLNYCYGHKAHYLLVTLKNMTFFE